MRRAFRHILKKEGTLSSLLKKEGTLSTLPCSDDGENGCNDDDEVISTLSEEEDGLRAADLECQIENLHVSANQALQISWVEAERLKLQNENLRKHAALLQADIDQLEVALKDKKYRRRVRSSCSSSDGSDNSSEVSSVTEWPRFSASHYNASDHDNSALSGEKEHLIPYPDLNQDSEDSSDSCSDGAFCRNQLDDGADMMWTASVEDTVKLRKYRRLLKRLGNTIMRNSGSSTGQETVLHVEQELMNHLALLENDMTRAIQDLEALLESKTSVVVALETLIREQNELMQLRREELQKKREKAHRLSSGTLEEEKNVILFKIQEIASEVRFKEQHFQQLNSSLHEQSAAIKSHTEYITIGQSSVRLSSTSVTQFKE